MARTPLILAALLLALTAACTQSVPAVQRLARYEGLLQRPLAERVLPADEAMLDRAHRTNLDYGDDVRPRAASPSHPLAGVVRAVLADLPPEVRRLAERHLVAVYLVEDDVGSATTEAVRSPDGRWRHAYVALNLTALTRDANAWATWKENSAFRPAPGHALRMTLEPAASDDRTGAVRFIVLHELGHVLGLGLGVHGSWEGDDPWPAPGEALPSFAAQSWRIEGRGTARKVVSRYREAQPALKDLGFYKFDKAPHTLADAPGLYAALAGTDFPSLYGTVNLYDDFAESFAIYVHAVLLGKPYRVEVLRDGGVVQTYTSCIASGACPGKIAQVKALLATPAGRSGLKIRMGIGTGAGAGVDARGGSR